MVGGPGVVPRVVSGGDEGSLGASLFLVEVFGKVLDVDLR